MMDGDWKVTALLALCHLIDKNWNCLKEGTSGEYLLTDESDLDISRLDGNYLGHNIACFAFFQEKDEDTPTPIAFNFNHVSIFQNPSQHAEHRLIEWLFRNPMEYVPKTIQSYEYDKICSNIILFSSLEPCWQCAGIAKMAGIKEIVYLQEDAALGGCMEKVSKGMIGHKEGTMVVTAGSKLGLGKLSMEFESIRDKDFYRASELSTPKKCSSVPSFLCTSAARNVIHEYSEKYKALKPNDFLEKLNEFILKNEKFKRGTMQF